MEIRPMVSVFMITYNHEKYIRDAIEGILMQKTTFPIKLVIGEDCSTDNTREICLEYKKKYPHIIDLLLPEHNLGLQDNFIITLNACNGKYVAFCEGDDYWTDPFKLQKQIDFLEMHQDYGLCYTKAHQYIQRLGKLGKVWGGCKNNDFASFLKRNPVPTLTVVARRELVYEYLEKMNPTKQGWLMCDYPMWLWFAHESKIKFIPEVTGIYRVLDNSASHFKSIDKYMAFGLSGIDVMEFFNQYFVMGITNAYFKHQRWILKLYSYSAYMKWKSFFVTYWEGICKNPLYLSSFLTYKILLHCMWFGWKYSIRHNLMKSSLD